MISAEDFWVWFKNDNAEFFFLNQIEDEAEKERILNKLHSKLVEYCDKLFFEVGGHPDEIQELIISSGGNKEYFNKVQILVDLAPIVPNWRVIALKQANDEDFTVESRGLEASPNNLWFLPLKNRKLVQELGIEIGFENYDKAREKDFLFLANLILENKLGEEQSQYIKHVIVSSLPNSPDNKGYIEFDLINDYLNWFLSKKLTN
jgi:hypothetical protein